MTEWIDASCKPECSCGCWSSPFVLLAVKQENYPAYYMLGYWHYSPDMWRNHYGPIEEGGLGLRVTYWMPLPPIPEG